MTKLANKINETIRTQSNYGDDFEMEFRAAMMGDFNGLAMIVSVALDIAKLDGVGAADLKENFSRLTFHGRPDLDTMVEMTTKLVCMIYECRIQAKIDRLAAEIQDLGMQRDAI